MGRSSKNKRKHQQQQQHQQGGKSKRQRKQRFWILDCQDTSTDRKQDDDEEEDAADIEILVTRTELSDAYKQVLLPDQDKATVVDIDPGTTESGNVTGDCETTKASVEAQIEDHDVPIHSLIPNVEQRSVFDLENQKELDTKNSTSVKVAIRKATSAKRPISKCVDYVENFKNLPNGNCGDGVLNPYAKDLVPDKYWSQRRRLFSLFDNGIQLDKESWYSVTPEAIANHIASHLLGQIQDAVVLDPFCGCGGNAIAFASKKEVKQVVCVDKDIEKLKKAHWNASIYGVQDKLLLVHADAGSILSRYAGGNLVPLSNDEEKSNDPAPLPQAIDLIFLSPPWGGVDYGKVGGHGYDLTCIKIDTDDGIQVDGEWLLEKALNAVDNKGIAYFLPKNIHGLKLAKSIHRAGCKGPIVLEQNVLNGKLKTVTAYLGLGS